MDNGKFILLKKTSSFIKGDFSSLYNVDKLNNTIEIIIDNIKYKIEYKQKISIVFINEHKVKNPVCTIPLKANNPHIFSCVIAPKAPTNQVSNMTPKIISTYEKFNSLI